PGVPGGGDPREPAAPPGGSVRRAEGGTAVRGGRPGVPGRGGPVPVLVPGASPRGTLPRSRPVPAPALPGAAVPGPRMVPVRRRQPRLPRDAVRAIRDEGPARHAAEPGPAEPPGRGALPGPAVRDRPGAGRRRTGDRPTDRLVHGALGSADDTLQRGA